MDLGEAQRITADAIGEPGRRTFYIQVRTGTELITVIVEKQQVQLLAASVLELMADLALETGTGPDEDEMGLEEPIDPRWRAGRLSIGFDQELDRFMLELEEYRPEPADENDEGPEDPGTTQRDPETIRIWATREQMFALSRHGAAVAQRGRPQCRFCANPLDPDGHVCPAMNGHRARA